MSEAILDRGHASLRNRARVSTIVIYIFIAVSLAQAIVDLGQLAGLIDLQALPNQTYVDVVDALFRGGSVLYLGSAVIIAFWIRRAHQNLFDAGYEGLEFTPGWSVGWFFVPFASLYMPYKAMRELWHASLGSHDGFTGNAPAELNVWWAAFLVGNFAAYGTVYPIIDLVSVAAQIISAWLLRTIIARITAAQIDSSSIADTFS